MTIKHAHGPGDALREAVRVNNGGPVLFIYEKHAAAQAALHAIGATARPQASLADELIDNLDRELAIDA